MSSKSDSEDTVQGTAEVLTDSQAVTPEFYKVGNLIIPKSNIIKIAIETSYNSKTGIPVCHFVIYFIGVVEVNDQFQQQILTINFFELTTQSKEDEFTQESISLLTHYLVQTMNEEAKFNSELVMSMERVGEQVGVKYKTLADELAGQTRNGEAKET